ncbi:MAG: hypothetical protein NC212_03780 [Staphylococcus sp.]|nr:hypothetical protein [Staphylococcus sp.]
MTNEDITRLRILIDRYYEAVSTPEEEAEMRGLLSDPTLPAEFAPELETVRHLDSLLPPEDFEKRIEAQIDSLASRRKHRLVRFRGWSVAASVVAVAAVGWSIINGEPVGHPGSDMTPDEIYAQTEEAFTIINDAFLRGYDEMERAEKTTFSVADKMTLAFQVLGIDMEETN